MNRNTKFFEAVKLIRKMPKDIQDRLIDHIKSTQIDPPKYSRKGGDERDY